MILFAVITIAFTACKKDGKSNGTSSNEKETYKSYDGKNRNLVFQDTVTSNKGIQYEIAFRGGMIDGEATVKARKDGELLEHKSYKADGKVTQVILNDINGDGEEDLIFYTNTEDPTRIGNLYGAIHENGKFRHIFISPFLSKPYVSNYFGRDSFYVENGVIFRQFPKYDLNQYNQKKDSGTKWVLSYKYTGRDTIAVTDGIIK